MRTRVGHRVRDSRRQLNASRRPSGAGFTARRWAVKTTKPAAFPRCRRLRQVCRHASRRRMLPRGQAALLPEAIAMHMLGVIGQAAFAAASTARCFADGSHARSPAATSACKVHPFTQSVRSEAACFARCCAVSSPSSSRRVKGPMVRSGEQRVRPPAVSVPPGRHVRPARRCHQCPET